MFHARFGSLSLLVLQLGQTLRNLNSQVRCYKSNYAKHLIEENHPTTPNNHITFLHFFNDKHKLDVSEAFETYKHRGLLL